MPRRATWNFEDVKQASSAANAASPRQTAPVDLQTVIPRLRDTVSAFWRQHGTAFKNMWRGLPDEERRDLLLTVSAGSMPRSRTEAFTVSGEDVHGAALLLPEINLEDLLGDESALPALFEARTEPDAEDQLLDDLAFIQDQIENKVRVNGRYLLNLAGGDPAKGMRGLNFRKVYKRDHLGGGEPMDIVQMVPQIVQLIEAGVLIPAGLFEKALERQCLLLQTLAFLADEYRTEYAQIGAAYAVSAPTWAPPGLTEEQLEDLWQSQLAAARRDRTQVAAQLYSPSVPTPAADEGLPASSGAGAPPGVTEAVHVDTGVSLLAEPEPERESFAQRVERAHALKDSGNDLFRADRFEEAKEIYSQVVHALSFLDAMDADEHGSACAALATTLSNRAACSNKLAEGAPERVANTCFREAKLDCETALSMTTALPSSIERKLELRLRVAREGLRELRQRSQPAVPTGGALTRNTARAWASGLIRGEGDSLGHVLQRQRSARHAANNRRISATGGRARRRGHPEGTPRQRAARAAAEVAARAAGDAAEATEDMTQQLNEADWAQEGREIATVSLSLADGADLTRDGELEAVPLTGNMLIEQGDALCVNAGLADECPICNDK
eukprot:gene1288-1874_t